MRMYIQNETIIKFLNYPHIQYSYIHVYVKILRNVDIILMICVVHLSDTYKLTHSHVQLPTTWSVK